MNGGDYITFKLRDKALNLTPEAQEPAAIISEVEEPERTVNRVVIL